MQKKFQSFRSRNRCKLKREKKPIKLKHITACIVYNIKQLSFT